MKPILLTLTAFGPFPGTEEIHFNKLGENPLFLINGPTGSGKTTILDAICFALYAKSTGDEREAAHMRCDFAEPEALTEVFFVFELAGKTYRIRRIPEQQRPKKRGEGYTTHPPHAELVELLTDGEERLIVAKKVIEATSEIELLTGLNADQFRQVMVLPQGKFRQLLMAESKDREQIFSKLFQTQIYKKLEDNLFIQAKKIRREVEAQRQTNLGILTGAGLDSMEALSEELRVLSPKWEQSHEVKQAIEKKHLDATNQLQIAKNLFNQFSELEKTRQLQKDLLANKPGFEQKRQQLSKAELALKLTPAHTDVNRCKSEMESATWKLQQTEKEKHQARERLRSAEQKLKEVDSLSHQLDQSKKDLTRLDGYLERAANFSKAEQDLSIAEKVEKEADNLLHGITEKLNKLVKDREQSEKELLELQRAQTPFVAKNLELSELSLNLDAKRELEDKQQKLLLLQESLNQAESSGKQLAVEYEKVKTLLTTLEINWHQGQAAALAKELQTGIPCPVCGSLDHPAPKVGKDAIPTEQEIEAARISKEKSEETYQSARDRYRELKNEQRSMLDSVSSITEKLGVLAQKPMAELKNRHTSLEIQITSLVKQQQQIENLSEITTKQKTEESNLRQTVVENQQLSVEKKALLASSQTRFENAKQELPEEYRQAGILELKRTETKKKLETLEKTIETVRKSHQESVEQSKAADAFHQAATEAHQLAGKALKSAIVRWQEVLEQSVFKTEATYLGFLMEDAPFQLLKQEIEAYDTQVNQIKGALEQQEFVLKNQKKPDLETLENALQKTELDKSEAEKAWQLVDKRLSQLQTTHKKLQTAAAEREKLEQRYTLVGTLSDVANGQTGNKVSLQRFVLSVLLDDVLIEASHRLRRMSKGRYQLLRKEDKSKGNKASGLDLEVEDAYSGKVRSVATLSGGESFMAALAMALGLSDVVQAYAGGIKLDTLFVDEGFGSLDPEALELAIRTLVDLQSSGRMIGIISHVSDLQEQLPTRLDITTDRKGSHVRLVTP